MIIGTFFINVMVNDNIRNERRYLKAGANAEQALGAVKVVKAFGQEEHEKNEYNSHLIKNNKGISQQASLKAFSMALVDLMNYILTFTSSFFGAIFVKEHVYNDNFNRDYRMGDTHTISQATMMVMFGLGIAGTNAVYITNALKACARAISVIEREPAIKIDDPEAQPVASIDQDIEFNDVRFTYKSRDIQVLKGVSLTFKRGEMTALVGISGSGKSTIVKLLERFYDPDSGTIMVNGTDLKNLNLREYRSKIGYVGQEPFLFNQTVKENLLNAKPDATDDEIDKALKDAMAYDFVQKMPNKLDTDVGAIGSKISGGQKQRIAIARALLRKPEVLILDEATSALDKKNERSVQKAIDRINSENNITTVVIAHRLSTIKDADMIYCFEKGNIAENGTHDQLMKNSGPYANFYSAQEKANEHVMGALGADQEVDAEGDEQLDADGEESVHMANSLVEEADKAEEQEYPELGYMEILGKLYGYTRPRAYLYFSIIGCGVSSCSQVLLGIPQGRLLYEIIFNDDDHAHQTHATMKYSAIIGGMGIVSFYIHWATKYFLSSMTFNLVQDMRTAVFDNTLKQPTKFYDRKENATGVLTSTLAADMKLLNGASFENYLFLFQGFSGLLCMLVIAFVYSWPMGVLYLFWLPITTLGCYYQFNTQIRVPNKRSKKNIDDTLVISESIVNQSTIATLGCDENISKNSLNESPREGFYVALAYSFTWLCTVSYFFLNFIVMGWMFHTNWHGTSPRHIIIVFCCGSFAALNIGVSLQNAPDWGAGKESANRILRVLESPKEGTEESSIKDGYQEMTETEATGDIEFKNVWFKYPTSTNGWVLKNFSLKIKTGQSIGLAGESGCGKSTLVQLLLRFYVPQKGEIFISGVPIETFTISSLRRHCGLVQQEPLIFNTTIMRNICYGRSHATTQEIQQAAEMANAATFINDLDENAEGEEDELLTKDNDTRYGQLGAGYKVFCGSKGNKLSGGQKQRIAIARAVIRNPSILMLDEATSALDESSQAIVQEALDKVMKTSTSIVIAHRLSTLSK